MNDLNRNEIMEKAIQAAKVARSCGVASMKPVRAVAGIDLLDAVYRSTHDYRILKVKHPMTAIPDVTPLFVTKTDVPPRNVLPALARLLIDMDRRLKLTNDGSLMMLKESSPATPWMMQPCPSQN